MQEHGMGNPAISHGALDRLSTVFYDQIKRGLHYGAQLAVYLPGEPVFSMTGGYADALRRRPVTPHTPFIIYSVTKSFVATAIHILVDRGLLDIEASVCGYWPEFSRHGKASITTRHLLLHQAGIPGSMGVLDLASWLLPSLRAGRSEALVPEHEPGARCVYHMFTAHIILGELIRRIDGRAPETFIEDELLHPLGMNDSYAGLPRSVYAKASRIYTGDKAQSAAARVFSGPLMRSAFMPAASINTTASDLAVFYLMLAKGGVHKGTRILSAEAVRRATAMQYDGPDGDSDRRIRWSMGFAIGGAPHFPDEDCIMMGHGSSERTFGHAGQGGCALGWADPGAGIAFAFVCNRFLAPKAAHARFEELSDRVWDALG